MEVIKEVINGGAPLPQRIQKSQGVNQAAGNKNIINKVPKQPNDGPDGGPAEKKPRFNQGGPQGGGGGGGQNQGPKGFGNKGFGGGNRGRGGPAGGGGGPIQNRGGNRGNFQNQVHNFLHILEMAF